MARRGRPCIKYDKETARQVQGMSQYGVPQEKIALLIGMDTKTLVKLYREEIDKGMTVANLNVARTLYKKAMDGDTASLIFWCKSRMKWRERDRPGENAAISSYQGKDWKEAFREAFNSVG